MPSEAFQWGFQLRTVEREFRTALLALHRLNQHSRDNPAVLLGGDIRCRDINTAFDRLEGTYLLRIFAEFETALRHYLRAFKIKVPPNAEPLINKVRDKAHISEADTLKVHAVRAYRNTLIHDDQQPSIPVSMRDATSDLGTFIAWLQRYW